MAFTKNRVLTLTLACLGFLTSYKCVLRRAVAIKNAISPGSLHQKTFQSSSLAPHTFPVRRYNISESKMPMPMRILHQYIETHGRDALTKHPEHRKFAVAIYQCPTDAGNSLHQFANGLLWSILTNRTLLWHYGYKETCIKSRFHDDCDSVTNTASDCSNILLRADWMAGYLEWKNKIHEEPHIVPLHVVVSGSPTEISRRDKSNFSQDDYGVDLDTKYTQQLLVWPRIYTSHFELGSSLEVQRKLLYTPAARELATQLFSLGADFLYGMLHSYAFQITEAIQDTVPKVPDMSKFYTVALHSRHRYNGLDGCNVEREIKCLQDIIKSHPSGKPLRVSMMSDRPCTISELSTWLDTKNISAVTVSHNDVTPDKRAEHGPFAGAGFYSDLAMILATAQDAFVAMRRSSSDLVREFVEFRRIMKQIKQGTKPKSLKLCVLPNIADPDEDHTKRNVHE